MLAMFVRVIVLSKAIESNGYFGPSGLSGLIGSSSVNLSSGVTITVPCLNVT